MFVMLRIISDFTPFAKSDGTPERPAAAKLAPENDAKRGHRAVHKVPTVGHLKTLDSRTQIAQKLSHTGGMATESR
jgi:hypothetical protein